MSLRVSLFLLLIGATTPLRSVVLWRLFAFLKNMLELM
jgi:hypothetical protein